MDTRIQKYVILLFALSLMGCYAYAQSGNEPKKGLFADKPKKLLVDLKAGRGFLGSMAGEDGGEAQVFCGGGSLSFGMMLRNNFVGLGGGVEYVDLLQGSYDFPVFLNLQHYLSKEPNRGFFVGAKLGYIFGGNKSIPTVVSIQGTEINGTIDRSMKGLYGEVNAGYCLYGINLFVSYNYRVISYETTLYPNNLYNESPYSSTSRVMHMVMIGFSSLLL